MSRRRWLEIAGTTGLVGGLAGCAGLNPEGTATESDGPGADTDSPDDGDGESTDSPAESGGDPVDPWLTGLTRSGNIAPENLNYNDYTNVNKSWSVNAMFFDRLAELKRNGDMDPRIAEDWEVTEEKATINVNDAYEWHNGRDLTAEDIRIKFTLDKAFELRSANFYDEAEVVDDTTLDLHFSDPVEKSLFDVVVMTTMINTPEEDFGEYVERWEEASSEEERTAIQEELLGYKVNEPIGNGPFKWTEAGVERVRAEVYDNHPVADDLNFTGYEAYQKWVGQEWQIVINDRIDTFGGGPGPNTWNEFPDHIRDVDVPRNGGKGFLFNWNHPDFERMNVRFALNWMTDFEAVQQGLPDPDRVDVPTPVGHTFLDQVSDDVMNNITDYTSTVDEDRATTLLQDEGYTKEGGEWMRPDGERFEFGIWNTGEPTVHIPWRNQLQDFGIGAEIVTRESSTWANEFFNNNFDVFMSWWGFSEPHIWFQLKWEYDEEYVPAMGKPNENYPVVTPIGDPDGSIEEMNMKERVNNMPQMGDEKWQETIDLCSWAWNQSAPCVPIWRIGPNKSWMDDKEWNWPSEEDIEENGFQYPNTQAVKTGRMSAKTE